MLSALGVRVEPVIVTTDASTSANASTAPAASTASHQDETGGITKMWLAMEERNEAQRLDFFHSITTSGTNAAPRSRRFQFAASGSVAADTTPAAAKQQQAAASADSPDARFLQLLASTGGLGGRIQGFLQCC